MSHQTHKRDYKLARQAYEFDRNNNPNSSFSVDMEKVLLLPHMPQYKEAIFTKRLVTFNETFARLGSDPAPVAIIWHEAIAGRKDENVSSSWVKALQYLAKERIGARKDIILWADNCSAQNKCWTLYTCLCWLVNSSEIGVDTITVKYLEPGHTYMSADSFHHKVEESIKQSKMLYDFVDFVRAVDKAGTPIIMNPHDFKSWPRSYGTSNSCKTQRPLLDVIKVVRFRRGSVHMDYQTEHGQITYKSAPFLRQKEERQITAGAAIAFPQDGPRGVATAKKTDIVNKLGHLMSAEKRYFWSMLPDSDLPDLNSVFD